MLGRAGGSDSGGEACSSKDVTLGHALCEGLFALTREAGEGELGVNGIEEMIAASAFALEFLGLAG